jgi:hypothetical protein
VIVLQHQLTIIISQSATNYNPSTLTSNVFNRVLEDCITHLKRLKPTFANTEITLPPLRKSNDSHDLANLELRRNLAAIGHRTKPSDYVRVKVIEAIKAAMHEEMYQRFYKP